MHLDLCEPWAQLDDALWVCECGRILYLDGTKCSVDINLYEHDIIKWKLMAPDLVKRVLRFHNITWLDGLKNTSASVYNDTWNRKNENYTPT